MEKCQNRETSGKGFFRQVLDGVQALHAQSIFHRDLKLSNILVPADNQVKIIDFGLATDSDDLVSNEFCGTMLYLAPEIVLNQPYRSSSVDLWTLGVILYALLFNTYPFGGRLS